MNAWTDKPTRVCLCVCVFVWLHGEKMALTFMPTWWSPLCKCHLICLSATLSISVVHNLSLSWFSLSSSTPVCSSSFHFFLSPPPHPFLLPFLFSFSPSLSSPPIPLLLKKSYSCLSPFTTFQHSLPEQITFALFYCPFLKHTLIFSVCFISTLFLKNPMSASSPSFSLFHIPRLSFCLLYNPPSARLKWYTVSPPKKYRNVFLSRVVKMTHQKMKRTKARVDNCRETGTQKGRWEKGKERGEEKSQKHCDHSFQNHQAL